ncbi:MAG: AAA family ATPase [Bacteroidales bacterium]
MGNSGSVEAINSLQKSFENLKAEIKKVVYGQDDVIEQVLTALFSQGHCLLIGVPGLAKTLLVNTVSKSLGLEYKRIQFTPDLMPSDIIGAEILDENRHFKFIKGPIFTNVLLADEINRTPPKTQSALLEAMQEHAVTATGNQYKLSEPFFVLATQNPIEQEGTYPLPEAQLDRFMFSVMLDYPSVADEITIVKNTTSVNTFDVNPVISRDQILEYQSLVRKVPVNDSVLEYAVGLASATRPDGVNASAVSKKYLKWGAGPRASQYLILGAKAHAALHGKYSPDIEDVKAVSKNILQHRIIKNYVAEAERITIDDIINELL